MRKELAGTGTPFGYTDPDLYEFELDKAYDAVLESNIEVEEAEAATVLLALQLDESEVVV